MTVATVPITAKRLASSIAAGLLISLQNGVCYRSAVSRITQGGRVEVPGDKACEWVAWSENVIRQKRITSESAGLAATRPTISRSATRTTKASRAACQEITPHAAAPIPMAPPRIRISFTPLHRSRAPNRLAETTGGEVVSQPLCPRLADVGLCADRAHRRNPVRRELPGEQLGRLLLEWVRALPGLGRAARGNPGTADDRHEERVRSDQRDRRRTGQGPRHRACSQRRCTGAGGRSGRPRSAAPR